MEIIFNVKAIISLVDVPKGLEHRSEYLKQYIERKMSFRDTTDIPLEIEEQMADILFDVVDYDIKREEDDAGCRTKEEL